MSNGYDFFGTAGGPSAPSTGGSPAPGDGAVPSVDRWGMPLNSAGAATQAPVAPTSGYAHPGYPPAGFATAAWQQPPAKQSKSMPLAIGGIVLAAAIAAGATFYLTRSHPISLPSSVGGKAELSTLTSSDKADIKNAEKDLANRAHIHDISSKLYGDDTGGYFMLAGHINGADTSMSDVENQIAAAAAGAGANFSTGTVSSGSNDFECVWASPGGHDVSVCFWWSSHSLLMGEGLGFDAQSTADALAEVKTYAGLK